MPLIIVTGHPCSGKSTFSLRLREYLEGKGCAVLMVNEESEKISRDVGYADSGREKTTRGVLKSAIDHNLNDRTYVIADSLNYIKGYRYELYCMARTQNTQHCCVLVQCNEEVSQQWYESKKELNGEVHDAAVMADLKRRFEMPNERNRWDTPLFKVDMTPQGYVSKSSATSSSLGKRDQQAEDGASVRTSSFRRKPKGGGGASVAVSTIRSTTTEKKSGLEGPLIFNRFDAIVDREKEKKESAEGMASLEGTIETIHHYLTTSEAPTPNISTVKRETAGANTADELMLIADEIISTISQHQLATAAEESSIPVIFPSYDRKIDLPPRRLGQTELLALKNVFVKMNRQHPPSSTEVGAMFIDFIASQI